MVEVDVQHAFDFRDIMDVCKRPNYQLDTGVGGGVLMDSHTESDSSDIANNYGMLGFWANSSAFGSTTHRRR